LTVVGIIVAAGLVLATSRASRKLNATIRVTDTQLVVENKESFDWTDVRITPGPCVQPVRSALLKAGGAWAVDLEDLRTVRGERFDPTKQRIETVWLVAEIPDGPGTYSWRPAGQRSGNSPKNGCS
jgi:hypothetical protein